MRELAHHGLDQTHVVGSLWNLLIVVWEGAATDGAVESVDRAAQRLLDTFPSGIGILGVAEGLDLRANERHQCKPLVERHGARLIGQASVIEGNGFAAVTARSVLSTINLVLRHPCPRRIFSTVDEGVSWLWPMLGRFDGKPTMATVRHAVEGLRSELRQHRSHFN
jgi:hypothetical protein